MDNPDDDYLSDNELRIRNLSANLRTATYEVATLRERLAAAERERDDAKRLRDGALAALKDALDIQTLEHEAFDLVGAPSHEEGGMMYGLYGRHLAVIEPLHATIAAQSAALEKAREALAFYSMNARLCRKVTSEGDEGRKALDDDGGKRADEAIAAIEAALMGRTNNAG